VSRGNGNGKAGYPIIVHASSEGDSAHSYCLPIDIEEEVKREFLNHLMVMRPGPKAAVLIAANEMDNGRKRLPEHYEKEVRLKAAGIYLDRLEGLGIYCSGEINYARDCLNDRLNDIEGPASISGDHIDEKVISRPSRAPSGNGPIYRKPDGYKSTLHSQIGRQKAA